MALQMALGREFPAARIASEGFFRRVPEENMLRQSFLAREHFAAFFAWDRTNTQMGRIDVILQPRSVEKPHGAHSASMVPRSAVMSLRVGI